MEDFIFKLSIFTLAPKSALPEVVRLAPAESFEAAHQHQEVKNSEGKKAASLMKQQKQGGVKNFG